MPFLSRTQLIKYFKSSKFVPESLKGQNYIVDYDLCRKIGTYAKDSEHYKCILEIGPGFGAFTDFLFPLSEKVCVVEKDPKSSQYLMDYYKSRIPTQVINSREIQYLGYVPLKTQLTIVEDDFFSLPTPEADLIISNIPFTHVFKFILKLTESWNSRRALLILQKEVMDHIKARPNQSGYTILSVLCGFFFDSQILLEIPSKSFYPKPKVSSLLIELLPNKNLDLEVIPKEERKSFLFFLKTVMPFKEKHLQNTFLLIQEHNHLFFENFPHFKDALRELNLSRSVLREMTPAAIFRLMQKSRKKNE